MQFKSYALALEPPEASIPWEKPEKEYSPVEQDKSGRFDLKHEELVYEGAEPSEFAVFELDSLIDPKIRSM